MKTRLMTALISVSLFCGSIIGCDETIKETIIDGLEVGATDVVTALITALFLSISDSVDLTVIVDSTGFLSSLLK